MFYILRFVIDVLYMVAIYFGYRLGQQIGMKYLFTDMYIAKLYCGFIGIAVVVFLFSKLKGSIIFFLKSVGLYAIATNTSGSEAFKNVMKQFDKILGVAVVTALITDAVNDVKQAMTEQDATTNVTKIFPVLENLPFSGVIDAVGKYYAKSFTYLDECILAYSFAMNKPIIPSLKEAFMQFLKKSYKIIGQLILSNIIMTIINVIIFIVGIIFYVQKIQITLYNLVVFYIVIRVIMYVIDDAFLEPMLLKSVILEYVQGIQSATDEFEENFANMTEERSEEHSDIKSEQNVQDAQDAKGESDDAAQIPLTQLLELPAVKKLMSLTDLKVGKFKQRASKINQPEDKKDSNKSEEEENSSDFN